MGFFDFLKSKNEKIYRDEIIDENYEESLYEGELPDNFQITMYSKARNVLMTSNMAMSNPTKQSIQTMKEVIKDYVSYAKLIEEDVLAYNGKYDIKAEHIATAFYLVNLGDMTYKDATAFSKIEIKNAVATNLMGLEYENIQANDIPEITVKKVQVTIKYLLSHDTE